MIERSKNRGGSSRKTTAKAGRKKAPARKTPAKKAPARKKKKPAAKKPMGKAAASGKREEQKARTRSALMESALNIIGLGANFASISLREVAKTAGVVPTSFYRHFGDMEELGLNMVDELAVNLRRRMRVQLDVDEPLEELVAHSVGVYNQYVLENTNLFDFLNQSRTGGTPAMRDAIRNELRFFGHHLASELGKFFPRMRTVDLEMIAQLIVSAVVENTTILLTLPKDAAVQQQELLELASRQVQLILLGAGQWQDREED